MYDTTQILKLASVYETRCSQDLITIARIKKMPGGKYRVVSQKGKNLGTCDSREEAEKRLKQVEFFKHRDKTKADDDSVEVIDLMGAVDFSYSAIMREMRQKASKEQFRLFIQLYKKYFDKAVKSKLQKPEKIALQDSLIKFNKLHKIKVKKKLVKNAAVSELGDPVLVGKYLSDIVKFTLNRIPEDKRAKAIESLRQKFYTFNSDEIAQKVMPASSSIGNCIAFVKHVLLGHNSSYIREVLDNISKNL